ncbi:MAG: DUF1214 domain-containing protein [Marinicaulis sp.]|nr:DUF1214 domain-containing protein [Marinicaulis sp.]
MSTKAIVLYASVVLFGLLVGNASALWMSGLIGKFSAASFANINIANWTSDRSIGAVSANPYTRARVARHGLLALVKEEAIYFTRSVDDSGEQLQERCTYVLSGKRQKAFWWSVTLYDSESRLPMNDDLALSIDATTIGERGEWTAIIAPTPPAGGHWISSRAAGRFDLTLRLYQPEADLVEFPEVWLAPPRIQKIKCEAAA